MSTPLCGIHPSTCSMGPSHSFTFQCYGLPTKVSAADSHCEELCRAQEDATAALVLTVECMKAHFDQHAWDASVFEPGQKVWLDTCNLQVTRMPQNLVDRYAGMPSRQPCLWTPSIKRPTHPPSLLCVTAAAAQAQLTTRPALTRACTDWSRRRRGVRSWAGAGVPLLWTRKEAPVPCMVEGMGPWTWQLGIHRNLDPCSTVSYRILCTTPHKAEHRSRSGLLTCADWTFTLYSTWDGKYAYWQ